MVWSPRGMLKERCDVCGDSPTSSASLLEHPGSSRRAKPNSLRDAHQYSASNTKVVTTARVTCIDFIFAGGGKLGRVGTWEKRKTGRDAVGFAFREGAR